MNRFNPPRTALAAALLAIGALSATSAFAQSSIVDSRHNLSSTPATGVTNRNHTSATDQICVFCHTPHGADRTQGPLWNRTASAATYVTYGTTLGGVGTTGSQTALTTIDGSATLPCLSCHDGTQALDSVLNAPGSGSGWAAAPTWFRGAGAAGSGDATVSGAANLGPDLRNDHPIGIQYANLTASATEGYKAVAGASPRWWVEGAGGTGGTRDKTDMFLFARDFGGTSGPSIECATCHDVHGASATNTMFLRQPASGSTICLTCHIK